MTLTTRKDECGRGKHVCKTNQPIHLTSVHHGVERVTNCLLWGAGDKPAVCHGTRDPKFSALSSLQYFKMLRKDMGTKSYNWTLNVPQAGHWSKWNIQTQRSHAILSPNSRQQHDRERLILFLVAQMVKSLPAMWEIWVWSLDGKMPWKRKWQPTPVFLPGEFQGQRNLVGYGPWGRKKSNTTEWLILAYLLWL